MASNGTIITEDGVELEWELGRQRYIRDIDERYTLVQDSQDVRATLESIGLEGYTAGHLFVLVGDGDYLQVWAGGRHVPYMADEVTCIYQEGSVFRNNYPTMVEILDGRA